MPSEFWHAIWCQKTRMVGLDGEKHLAISFFRLESKPENQMLNCRRVRQWITRLEGKLRPLTKVHTCTCGQYIRYSQVLRHSAKVTGPEVKKMVDYITQSKRCNSPYQSCLRAERISPIAKKTVVQYIDVLTLQFCSVRTESSNYV